jgi:hypothetical protein
LNAIAATPRPEPGAAAPPAGIRGAVDNVGAERIYGWAFHPGRPGERLTIEVRLSGRLALATKADAERADLAPAGIGDGRHAFTLRLNAECVARRAELTVVARSEDGTEFPLPFRVKRTPEITAAQAKQAVEALAEDHRDLRAAIAALQETQAQARLSETATRLETAELWLARLDERIAALPARPAPSARKLDPWQAFLMALLSGIAGAGLAAGVLHGMAL